jgi:hypothetical protein
VSERSAVNQERLQRAEQPFGTAGGRLQLDQLVCQRLAAVAALALLGGDRAPELVDDGARLAGDLVDVAFEMGGPQSQSCVARERSVASNEVDFAVVIKGVGG